MNGRVGLLKTSLHDGGEFAGYERQGLFGNDIVSKFGQFTAQLVPLGFHIGSGRGQKDGLGFGRSCGALPEGAPRDASALGKHRKQRRKRARGNVVRQRHQTPRRTHAIFQKPDRVRKTHRGRAAHRDRGEAPEFGIPPKDFSRPSRAVNSESTSKLPVSWVRLQKASTSF